MDSVGQIQFFVVIFIMMFSAGVGLYFVGWLAGLLTALGHKRYGWGISIFLVNPLVVLYGFQYATESQYPKRLTLWGAGLVASAIAIGWLLYGNDFFAAVADSIQQGPKHSSAKG